MSDYKMYSPGFYKANPKAISIGELTRWYGIWRLPMMYYVTRFRTVGSSGIWMPHLWADLECDKQALSDRLWQITEKHRADMEKLGFINCGFAKVKAAMKLDPLILDSGGIHYLHKDNSQIGSVTYVKTQIPAPINKDREVVVIVFSSAFQKGSLSCTNHKRGFEPDSDRKVIRIYKDDVFPLHDKFLKALKRQSGQPITFSDPKQMHQWFDADKTKSFESKAKRGLYVKMSDAEVEQARKKVPPRIAT